MTLEEFKATIRLEFILEDKRQCIGSEKNFKAIETVLKLIDKQEKEIEHELNQRKYWRDNFYKQQKEIEELKEEVKRQGNAREIEEEFIEKNYISKDRIKEALGFGKDTAEILGVEEDMTEEQILSYIDTLVSENNRLEDIEDRKVQVAVDNIEKQRDKYWGDKIREILKNYLFTEAEGLKEFYQDIFELVREIDRNNEDLFTLGELEYAISHSEEFDFGSFNQETIEEAVKTIKKLDKIIQSFESGEMITGVKNG